MLVAVLLAAAIQAANMTAQNVAAKWPAMVGLIHLSVLLPIALSTWWLLAPTPVRFLRPRLRRGPAAAVAP